MTQETITPFGSGITSDIPVQNFMGASVVSFTCSADFTSQPGSCTIKLVQDDTNGDLFSPGVIGSAQFFEIVDADGDTIFEYNGVLDGISRDTAPEGKDYTITLVSPLRILEATTLILGGYTGYGTTTEGLPRYFSEDGYYQINDADRQPGYLPDGVSMVPTVSYFETSQFSYATNNANLGYTGMWSRVFNLINVFAAYENEWRDANNAPIAVVPFAGFGASGAKNGMRVDKIVYALDEIINRTEPNSPRRYIGGNLMYGSNSYNICSTSAGFTSPFPYYYGFDIIDFASRVLYYLPEDFVVPGPSTTLAELIGLICDTINADFIIELNDPNTYKNGAFLAGMSQTYPNSVLGGILSVLIIPRNQYVTCERPFSQFTYDLINLEQPDMGDYQYVGSDVNPGVPPAQDGRFINPLDLDYTDRGTVGSRPFGGKFPVSTAADSSGTITEILNRAQNISVSLKSTNPTVAKMVVGGYQTRMNVVPRDYIYQYWGEISLVTASGDSCGVTASSKRSVPVITQTLPPNDGWDWIAIDMQSVVSNETVAGLFYDGIYFASVLEIRAAMCSFEAWRSFLMKIKKHKWDILNTEGLSTITGVQEQQHTSTVGKYLKFFFGRPLNPRLSYKKPSKESVLEYVYEKIKNIGDTHYGKSWVAPIPLFKSKLTENDDNLIGNFTRSWDLTDSAYVEPYVFGTIEAPKDSSFIDNGKLTAFANFEHSFTAGAGDLPSYDLLTGQLSGFASGIRYKYDFSAHGEDTVYDFDPAATGDCSVVGLAHAKPTIDSKYLFIPYDYFNYYNRGHCPFIDNIDKVGEDGLTCNTGKFYMFTYNFQTKAVSVNGANKTLVSSAMNDTNSKTFATALQISGVMEINETNYLAGKAETTTVYSPCDGTIFTQNARDCEYYTMNLNYKNSAGVTLDYNIVEPATGSYDAHFAFQYAGTALKDILDGISANAPNDNGNGFPFVKFTTLPVYYPETLQHPGINPLDSSYLDNMDDAIRTNSVNRTVNGTALKNFGSKMGQFCLNKCAVPPRSVGIPQKSNRYVYGPWITNFSDVIFCGKFEYEQDEELVPENFLIPIYGTLTTNWQVVDENGSLNRVIGQVKGTSISGFAGMNLAGQAIANSIDNFSLFAQEEGNLTIPGLPIVTRIGQTLLNGPRVTDISVSVNNSKVETTYNFRTLSPRIGKTSKELVKTLRKISNTVKYKGK